MGASAIRADLVLCPMLTTAYHPVFGASTYGAVLYLLLLFHKVEYTELDI